MLSIFNYTNPDEYLKDIWLSKRQLNQKFTIRSWANLLGFKHHNSLHEMVQGKRKIPKDCIPTFIKSIGLDAHEAVYFELMVDLSRAKTADQRLIYLQRMKSLSPDRTQVSFKELESFRLLQNPIHFFICELALHRDFQSDPVWIKNRLDLQTSVSEVKDAIERLISLDILREDIDGRLHRVDQFIQSKSDIHDKGLKEYHKNLMELAKVAVDSQDVLEREFQGMALNVDTHRLPEAKKFIRDFVNSFTAKFDTPKVENEQVYQLNLQFFRITKDLTQEIKNA